MNDKDKSCHPPLPGKNGREVIYASLIFFWCVDSKENRINRFILKFTKMSYFVILVANIRFVS